MLFGEAQHHPKFDPETMFMEGPHGREYLRLGGEVVIQG